MGAACCKALGKQGDVTVVFVGVADERKNSDEPQQPEDKKEPKALHLKHSLPGIAEPEAQSTTSETTEDVDRSTRPNTDVESSSRPLAILVPNPLQPPAELCAPAKSNILSEDFSVPVERNEDDVVEKDFAASASNYLTLFQNMMHAKKEVLKNKGFENLPKQKLQRLTERVTLWLEDVPMTLPAVLEDPSDFISNGYDARSKDEEDDDQSELDDLRRRST